MLGKRIGLEETISKKTNGMLVSLVFTMERCKIQIRRSIRLVLVAVVGPENVVNDEGGLVEQQAGNAAVALSPLILAREQKIEEITRIWLGSVYGVL